MSRDGLFSVIEEGVLVLRDLDTSRDADLLRTPQGIRLSGTDPDARPVIDDGQGGRSFSRGPAFANAYYWSASGKGKRGYGAWDSVFPAIVIRVDDKKQIGGKGVGGGQARPGDAIWQPIKLDECT